MALVPLKCPKCGSSINLDDQQETGTCDHCGSQFAFQEAARKYMVELAGKITPDGKSTGGPVVFSTTTTTTINGKTTTVNGQDTNLNDVMSQFFGTSSGIPTLSTEPISGYELPEKIVIAIRLLVADDQKIKAIKLFREYTNTGLKEAKDVIDRLDATPYAVDPAAQKSGSASFRETAASTKDSTTIPGYTLDPKVVDEILSCLAKNQKIAAIKVLREAADTGLKEAKDAIDSLDARQPQRNSSTAGSAPKGRTDDPSLKVSKCYIATAVYGSYEAPEVRVLRRFRDEVLTKSMAGRAFIRSYYAVSPPVARRLENAGRINRLVRRMLDKIVHRLDTGAGS
jgi:ribosomal protein L7/L12/DNA-directed RNA polymerase subunit RPC12/RpoP